MINISSIWPFFLNNKAQLNFCLSPSFHFNKVNSIQGEYNTVPRISTEFRKEKIIIPIQRPGRRGGSRSTTSPHPSSNTSTAALTTTSSSSAFQEKEDYQLYASFYYFFYLSHHFSLWLTDSLTFVLLPPGYQVIGIRKYPCTLKYNF